MKNAPEQSSDPYLISGNKNNWKISNAYLDPPPIVAVTMTNPNHTSNESVRQRRTRSIRSQKDNPKCPSNDGSSTNKSKVIFETFETEEDNNARTHIRDVDRHFKFNSDKTQLEIQTQLKQKIKYQQEMLQNRKKTIFGMDSLDFTAQMTVQEADAERFQNLDDSSKMTPSQNETFHSQYSTPQNKSKQELTTQQRKSEYTGSSLRVQENPEY